MPRARVGRTAAAAERAWSSPMPSWPASCWTMAPWFWLRSMSARFTGGLQWANPRWGSDGVTVRAQASHGSSGPATPGKACGDTSLPASPWGMRDVTGRTPEPAVRKLEWERGSLLGGPSSERLPMLPRTRRPLPIVHAVLACPRRFLLAAPPRPPVRRARRDGAPARGQRPSRRTRADPARRPGRRRHASGLGRSRHHHGPGGGPGTPAAGRAPAGRHRDPARGARDLRSAPDRTAPGDRTRWRRALRDRVHRRPDHRRRDARGARRERGHAGARDPDGSPHRGSLLLRLDGPHRVSRDRYLPDRVAHEGGDRGGRPAARPPSRKAGLPLGRQPVDRRRGTARTARDRRTPRLARRLPRDLEQPVLRAPGGPRPRREEAGPGNGSRGPLRTARRASPARSGRRDRGRPCARLPRIGARRLVRLSNGRGPPRGPLRERQSRPALLGGACAGRARTAARESTPPCTRVGLARARRPLPAPVDDRRHRTRHREERVSRRGGRAPARRHRRRGEDRHLARHRAGRSLSVVHRRGSRRSASPRDLGGRGERGRHVERRAGRRCRARPSLLLRRQPVTRRASNACIGAPGNGIAPPRRSWPPSAPRERSPR